MGYYLNKAKAFLQEEKWLLTPKEIYTIMATTSCEKQYGWYDKMICEAQLAKLRRLGWQEPSTPTLVNREAHLWRGPSLRVAKPCEVVRI